MGKSYTDALDIYEIQSVVIEAENNKLKASEDKEIMQKKQPVEKLIIKKQKKMYDAITDSGISTIINSEKQTIIANMKKIKRNKNKKDRHF